MEAALKLARKVTGRESIINWSELDESAAVIVETTQGDGGLNVARYEWLQALEQLCRRHGMLLIIDDVQMGCGRTGPFFSFEPAGITPDIVTLSKSISGYGLPMALTLLRPELDVWEPGEHNGTFRGNNAAFVTATRTLEIFWTHDTLQRTILDKGDRIDQALVGIATDRDGVTVRGRGMAKGLAFAQAEQAAMVCTAAFDRGLLMETTGPSDEVAKLMPALTISYDDLDRGLDILAEVVAQVHD